MVESKTIDYDSNNMCSNNSTIAEHHHHHHIPKPNNVDNTLHSLDNMSTQIIHTTPRTNNAKHEETQKITSGVKPHLQYRNKSINYIVGQAPRNYNIKLMVVAHVLTQPT